MSNDTTVALWESAQAAIGAVAGRHLTEEQVRAYAKDAVVAVLRTMSEQATEAEDNGQDWPDSGDLWILAEALENERIVDGAP
jgi:hypothetical protein